MWPWYISRYFPSIRLEELRKNMSNFRIVGVPASIRSRQLPNKEDVKQKRYSLRQHVQSEAEVFPYNADLSGTLQQPECYRNTAYCALKTFVAPSAKLYPFLRPSL
jgi:hypothetical protein